MAEDCTLVSSGNNRMDRDREVFVSRLGHGKERFLAHVIEQGLEVGRRTPEDFIRHFPPGMIMLGLGDRPDLRANILVLTTGVKLKIALKKSAETSGEDLQIALDEQETDAESIVLLFHPDDRVRYLDHRKLWSFVTEGEFWRVDSTQRAQLDARARTSRSSSTARSRTS